MACNLNSRIASIYYASYPDILMALFRSFDGLRTGDSAGGAVLARSLLFENQLWAFFGLLGLFQRFFSLRLPRLAPLGLRPRDRRQGKPLGPLGRSSR